MIGLRRAVVVLLVGVLAQVMAGARGQGEQAPGRRPVSREPLGQLPDGRAVERFTITNANGVEIRAITYGGIITSIRVPDRAGTLGDVVLGFDTLDGYLTDHPFFGAIIGRYGNPFVAVGADVSGRAAIEWGVYGVPETFVVGRDGRIAYKLVGPITAQNFETQVKPAIEKALAAGS